MAGTGPPATAFVIRRHTGQHLVAVQSVLRQDYWEELKLVSVSLDEQVIQIVLDADETTLRNRIENDQVELSGRQWRLDHFDRYAAARKWMTREADLVIDTSRLAAEDVVPRIADAVRARSSRSINQIRTVGVLAKLLGALCGSPAPRKYPHVAAQNRRPRPAPTACHRRDPAQP